MGVTVKRVGEDFDYKGVRAPYYLNIDEIVSSGPDDLRFTYELVRAEFAKMLRPEGELKASRVTPQDLAPRIQTCLDELLLLIPNSTLR